MSSLPRVLILAENCNPEWPSLPVVGYKYARALSRVADVTIATHIRNRGGNEVAWSTNQMMAYPPYIAFERQVLGTFRTQLNAGEFDLVHRITPMSPTLPSYIAGRTKQPFLIGPLNGNLDWPAAFHGEQKREREGLRKLRGAYRYLPFARSTYRKAACVMAAFQHTIDDLSSAKNDTIVPFPEIGFDPEVFHSTGRATPFVGDGPKRFLFAGRLVPYKVPEAAVQAFVDSEALRPHILHILGDGPEQSRLEAIVADAGAQDRVIFEGRKTQSEVADFMRRCDAFVFPSIRELGAGVVIEAMASGMVCLVTDYGAPGDLVAGGRGVQVPLQPMEGLVRDYRAAMEACLTDPTRHAQMAEKAETYAKSYYDWDAKAHYTMRIYEAVMAKEPLTGFTEYR